MITCDYNQPTQELHFREKKSWLGQKSKFSTVTQLWEGEAERGRGLCDAVVRFQLEKAESLRPT